MDENNMRLYEQGRSVPKNAQKAFSNGRFSGTDINPMWRIKKLTEMFGPVGFGWYTEVTRQEVIPADDGNVMAFVDINLFVKEGDTWSKPIFGTGGNTLKTKGKGDDDGFKKAYTDALSIACKALGIGADIWYSADVNADFSSKYASMYTEGENTAQESPVEKGKGDPLDDVEIKAPTCERCHKVITGKVLSDGTTFTAPELIANSKLKYFGVYCWDCMQALKKLRKEHANGGN
jgi:hypothetical protein